MLWIEKYRPELLSDIIGQDPVIRCLSSFAGSGTVPHLILSGPHGTGKSAAIECFAKVLFKENWELNTSVFQTSDLFSQGKTYLEQDGLGRSARQLVEAEYTVDQMCLQYEALFLSLMGARS